LKTKFPGTKYWEIIADNLKKAGWSLGYVSAIDSEGRTIWIVDAHRDGQRFIVRAEEKLTAFLGYLPRFRKQSAKAVFRELGSVVTVETRWSLEVVFPSRAVFSWAARQSHNPPRKLVGYRR
jgi:hypothetical protein